MSQPDANILEHESDPWHSVALSQRLHQRAKTLLQELDAFEAHVKSHGKEKEVEIRVFKRGVETEMKGLRNIATYFISEGRFDSTVGQWPDKESPHLHALKSSNLPFYESIWKVVKDCRRVTALSKRFYAKQRKGPRLNKHLVNSNVMAEDSRLHSQKGVLVDIVADNGLDWIKISTISEKRLLHEIAKEGWESYMAEISDDESTEKQVDVTERHCHQLELVRLAHELRAVSKGNRVQFQHPHVRFVLPNIREGQMRDVDAFVADLRATGATVQCSSGHSSDELDQDASGSVQPAILDQLLPGYDQVHRTDMINLDCTILLAIISDISHLRKDQISPDSHTLHGTYHSAILRQIESEESKSMIRSDIYPILIDRMLHCTSSAAQRMREIVQCMGTPSESERADIILGEGKYEGRTAEDLRGYLNQQSIHAVPAGLQLPVKVVAFDSQDVVSFAASQSVRSSKYFPHLVAAQVIKLVRLTPINSSVFLYGWKEQSLTFTSNRVVATGLVKAIDEVLDHDESEGNLHCEEVEKFYGPQIHICETARSLIGKAKNNGPS